MLTYRLLCDTDDFAAYAYFPEGNESDPGLVTISKRDGSVQIKALAPSDHATLYARHMFSRLRQFNAMRSYRAEGLVAWY